MTKKIKFMAALCAIAAFLLTKTTNAQTIGDGKLRFGIGFDGLLPLGDLSTTETYGLGITPRLQYAVSNRLTLTFTSGIYHFFPRKLYFTDAAIALYYPNYHLNIIPVKFGLKAFVVKNIYLAGEVGAGFVTENGGGPAKLILSPAVGYASKNWDVGVRYENFSGSNNTYDMLALRVAYGFGL